MQRIVFRNSIRHLRGVWPTRLLPTILVVVFLDRISDALPGYWFEIAVAIFLALTLAAFLEPVWDAKFRILTVSGDEITLQTGWISPELRSTRLSRITSVQVDEPLSQRLANVRSVTIVTSGATDSTLRMPALTPAASDQLCSIISTARPDVTPLGSRPAPEGSAHIATGPDEGRQAASVEIREPDAQHVSRVYEASFRDTLATAVAGGYPLAVLAGVIGATADVSELTGTTAFALAWTDPRSWFLALASFAVIFAAATAAKYWQFHIDRTPRGEFVVSYGALERTRHTISAGAVVSTSLVRTPVDVLFGTTRLELSTARLGEGDHKSLVFPSMSAKTTARVVCEIMGRPVPELFVKRRAWLLTGPLLIVGLAVGVALLVARQNLLVGAFAALAALMVLTVLTRYVQGRVSIAQQPGGIAWSDVGLAYRVTTYSRDCVRLVIERRLPGLPLGNLTILGWAHARVTHRCPVISRSVYRSLVDTVLNPKIDPPRTSGLRTPQEAP